MKEIRIFLFFSIVLLFPLSGKADKGAEKSFFSKLHHPRLIMDMCYDQEGFLWIGSGQMIRKEDRDYGLMRFDGNRFHTINLPDLGNENASVMEITRTKNELFYLHCWGQGYQLLTLDPRSVQFHHVDLPGFNKQVFRLSRVFSSKGKYYVIAQDSSGHASLFQLDRQHAHKMIDIAFPDQAQINQFTVFIPYKDYFFLKTSILGSRLFNWQGREVKKLNEQSPFRRFSLVSFEGEKGFLREKDPVLYTFNTRKRKIVPLVDCDKIVGNHAFWFWNDEKGHLLLSVEQQNGIVVYRITSEGAHKIKRIEELSIINWPVFYAENALKSLWIGNQAKHLTYYGSADHKIKTYLKEAAIGPLFPLSKHKILVATVTSGLYAIDLDKKKSSSFDLTYMGKPYKPVYCRNIIAAADTRYLWSNSRSSIVRIDRETHQVERWKSIPIESLSNFNDSLLVFGTFKGGIRTFNKKTKKFHELLQDHQHWIRDLQVKEGTVFAATYGGLLLYNLKSKERRYKFPDSVRLEDRNFNCLRFLSSGDLILGSNTGKVYRFNIATSSFRLLYNVPDNAPISSLGDYAGSLWIGTEHGFYQMNLATERVQNFSTIDGFSYNYATPFSQLTIGNKLFIGTRQGLNCFDPALMQSIETKGEIVPVSLKLYNRQKDTVENILNRDKLASGLKFVLPVQNRLFRLTFGMKNKDPLHAFQFKYRLNRQKWISIDGGNFIQFDHLTPGKYYLEVGAFDAYGKQVGTPLYYRMKVKDFFYHRWWFAASIVFVVFLILGGVIFSRKKQKELALKKEAWENLNKSMQSLQEKYEIGRQLFIEKQEALIKREQELVANSLQVADLKRVVRQAINEWEAENNQSKFKRKLEQILSRSDDWDFFVKKFTEVYPDFIETMTKEYPCLTRNDLDFCILIKLNLDNKEMAKILNISHQSVITKRYRLRKKIGFTKKETHLDHWIAEI